MSDVMTALLLVAATAIGSFAASWLAFRTSARLAERQLVQAREFDAVVQILALVHQLERDLWSRANEQEIRLANKEARSEAVGAKLDQLSAYHAIYEPWLSKRASLKLGEIRSAAASQHVELALALKLNVTDDPGDPRSVRAVKALEAWLKEEFSPAERELQEEFRAMVKGDGEGALRTGFRYLPNLGLGRRDR